MKDILTLNISKLGYTFDAKTKDWIKQATEGGLEQAQVFCRHHKLQLFVDYPHYRRNSTYRQTYFESHPGLFGRDFYFCSYCGRLLHKDRITVDHLFAVKAVQRSAFLKWILQELKIEDVNNQKNLVAACTQCNERKGTKGGVWILRGLIGRHPLFWFCWWPIFLAILIAIIAFCFPLVLNNFKSLWYIFEKVMR